MSRIDELINKEREKIKQLEKRKKLEVQKEKAAKEKIDKQRIFVVGALMIKYFPDLLKLEPKSKKADTEIEFKAFENILAVLSKDEKAMKQLWTYANQL